MFPKNTLALAVMAATVSFASAQVAFAEEVAEKEKNVQSKPTLMNQVTVTAARSEKQLKDVAGSVVVIDEEQIEKNLSTDIKDLIRYEPGVSAETDGRTGTKGFNIRGMDGNRVKIMVDGVDQPQQFDLGYTYQGSQRNFIDVDTLKAVEIVKGPSSALYGSDAIGGIVAFQTKDPADYLKGKGDDTAVSAKGVYSSADQGFSETFTLANRSGDIESLLVYTRRDHKETETHGGEDILGANRAKADPIDASGNSILGKLQYQINETHRIGLASNYYESKNDIELKSGDGGKSSLPSGTTGSDKMTLKHVGVFHEWEASSVMFDHLRWQLDWQETEANQQTNIPAYGSFDDRVKTYSYGEESLKLASQFSKSIDSGVIKHNFIYGFDVNKVKTTNNNITNQVGNPEEDNSYIPRVDALNYGLFLQDDIALTDRLTLIPGVRYDSFDYSPKGKTNTGEIAKDKSDSKLTGRLGATFDINTALTAFGQLSQGYKAPGLYEMYYTLDGGFYKQIANPDLKPEESNSVEFGLRGENALGGFELTGFYNRYSNFIDSVSDLSDPAYPSGITQYQNIAKAEIKGVEFRGQLWLDEISRAPSGTWLQASLAFAEGENRETKEKLNSVAPLTAVLGLGYDDNSGLWGSELSWTLVKGKDDEDVSNDGLRPGKTHFNPSGYGLLDFTAYYLPLADLTLRAGLFNITDKKYHSWDDIRGVTTDFVGLDRYTQPGRNFSVSAKYDF